MSRNYIGDFSGTETFPVTFDSFNSSGGSTTFEGSPAFSVSDIVVYKSPSMTQRASTSGYSLLDTDGIDLDGVTGIHGFTIDLSDDTDSGFYADGNDYYIVVRDILIDGQTVNFVAASFSINNRNTSANVVSISGDTAAADNLEAMYDGTGYTNDNAPATQQQIGSLAVGSAAISTQAESYTLTTGTQSSGTFSDTATLDDVDHQHTDTGGALDLYYQFDVGGAGIATESVFNGYLQGSNDSLSIQAYNWSGAAWDDIGTLQGANGTTEGTQTLNLLARHTGTGANLGKVRIRFFAASGLTAATLSIDRIFVSYAVVNQSVGYAGGKVWINTVIGTAGTESFVNGVADNAVDTLADAITIATNVGLSGFSPSNGSSLTLASTLNNYVFEGFGWSLALGSQDIGGTYFYGALPVTGTATNANGSAPIFDRCVIGTATLTAETLLLSCNLSSTVTLTSTAGVSADTFVVNKSQSGVAGPGSPHIDASGVTKATAINIRKWSGGLTLTLNANCTVSLEGVGGIVTINGTGGTVFIRGIFQGIVDNSSGAVSFSVASPVADQVHQGTAQAGTANSITLAATASATDGAYDPGRILIVAGPGSGESRGILEYDGTTKVAVVDKDWRTTPTSASSYVIFASSGALHVNEGLAQGGAASTITLNTAASSTDDIYVGQTIFILGGAGQDQSRIVTAYNGTTKVATVHKAWDVTPGATSSYVMLPLPAIGDYIANATPALIADQVWDELLSAAEHNTPNSAGRRLRQAQAFQGYFDGAVYIDGVNGAAGTTIDDNGTVESPSDTLADATVLAAALGYRKFISAPNTVLTMSSGYTGYVFDGDGYGVDINSQAIDSCRFYNAGIQPATATSAALNRPFFRDCLVGAGGIFSVGPSVYENCLIEHIQVNLAGEYIMNQCGNAHSDGSDTTIDCGIGIGPTSITMHKWSGNVTFSNLEAGDVLIIDGVQGGEITLNGADATVEVSGVCTVVNNLTGSPTVDTVGVLNETEITSNLLTTQMTESYAADGVAPTLSQALFLIQQMLAEHAAVSTTLTVKRLDGTTTAATFTFDDASNPTSITRSS